jgi:hypothetical protein
VRPVNELREICGTRPCDAMPLRVGCSMPARRAGRPASSSIHGRAAGLSTLRCGVIPGRARDKEILDFFLRWLQESCLYYTVVKGPRGSYRGQ